MPSHHMSASEFVSDVERFNRLGERVVDQEGESRGKVSEWQPGDSRGRG